MHKPESVRQNEIHKILLDFKIQSDYIILAKRQDLVKINEQKKRTFRIVELEIGGRINSIKSTALLKSTSILRVPETCRNLMSLRPSPNAGVKNS